MRLILKGCPRCGGDLFPEMTEAGEPTFLCLQCGRTVHNGRGRLFPSSGRRMREPAGPERAAERVAATRR